MRPRTSGFAIGLCTALLIAAHSAAQPANPAAPAAPASAAPTASASAAPQAPAAPPKPLAESLTGLAKAEYEGAKILYGDKDFASAAAKFQRAYELSSDPRLLFNIAVCQKNLRKYSKMLATVRRYLEDGHAILSEDDKNQAHEIVKTVEAFVSELKLTVDEPDADVYVDDEKLGVTPIKGPVFLDVGVRKLRVTKPGYKEVVLSRQVPGGGPIAVDVRLEKEIHRGKLVIAAGPEDLITLDNKVIGKGKWEGTVPSGGHTLKVSAPGMQTHQSEVVIQDNQTRTVNVTLNPSAKDPTATILWIAGGAVVLAGAAVGGALLFQPPKATPIDGNFGGGRVQLNFNLGGSR